MLSGEEVPGGEPLEPAICRRVPPARGQSAGGRTRPSRGGWGCLLETLDLGVLYKVSLVLTLLVTIWFKGGNFITTES